MIPTELIGLTVTLIIGGLFIIIWYMSSKNKLDKEEG